MDKIKKISKNVILSNRLPVLICVYSRRCEPCKRVTTMLEELEKTYYGRVVFYKLDGSAEN